MYLFPGMECTAAPREPCAITRTKTALLLNLPCRLATRMRVTREYQMVYREPGFLTVYDSAPSFPSPLSRQQVLSPSYLPVCRRSSSLTGEAGRGRAWSQIIRPREGLALYKSFNLYASNYLYHLLYLYHNLCLCKMCFIALQEKK
jgi:hypothetical protein